MAPETPRAPHPHNPMPYGLYFLLAFLMATVAGGVAVSLLHDMAMEWPVSVRLGLAVAPLVLGALYGARVFTFGRVEKLTLRQALRRGLGLSATPTQDGRTP